MSAPQFTTDDLLPPHMLAYGIQYERDICADMERARIDALVGNTMREPVVTGVVKTITGVALTVYDCGRG